MAGTPFLHAGLDSHYFPNLAPVTSASRVSSDPTNTDDKSSHKHTSLQHLHESHPDGQHRHRSSRRHAKDVVQSAIQLQPPASFGDLLKQARGGSKDTSPSPSHSRKGSVAQGDVDGNVESKGSDVGITIPPRKPLRPEDVERERKRVEARERDLRTTLHSLSDQSLKTSRRLDDTYYSILEKVSVLRQTIGSLQELSSLTKELHENFEADTKELLEDVGGQFDTSDNFDPQQQQITWLEERIVSGKEKAAALNERLAKAKERVDARAKSEVEWNTKSTRRLRIFWSTLGSIATVVLALILFYHFRPLHVGDQPKTRRDFASRGKIKDALIPDMAKEFLMGSSLHAASSEPETAPSVKATVSADDVRLRVFDEL